MPRYLSGFMKVHYGIEGLPQFKNAVLTIGTFDGVHYGHQKIIDALIGESDRVDGETVLLTFHPHPRKIIQPQTSLQLINTLNERLELLQKKGLDHLVVVPFTKAFSELTGEEYLEQFLVKNFHPRSIIIGYDHHFGKNRSGNFSLLEKGQAAWNYTLIEIPKYLLDEISVSSTQIRKALTSGDVAAANKLLAYAYFFEGEVVQGDQLGRKLGFPTANLIYTDKDKIRLGEGVYAVKVSVNGLQRQGMLSIGKRPTLNDVNERIEVNIFDFNENIYGHTIKIYVEAFLRKQEKYDSLEELKAQIALDKKESLRVLNG